MGHVDKPDTGEFLSRWSRRKLEAGSGEEAGQALEPSSMEPPQPPQEADQPPPRSALTDEDMPDIETLDDDSDFSGFLSPRVSDALRRKALRKLFHMPSFNITDGLNDYDEDYTRHAGLGGIVTHEMKRALKRELEAERRRLETEDPAQDRSAEESRPGPESGEITQQPAGDPRPDSEGEPS